MRRLTTYLVVLILAVAHQIEAPRAAAGSSEPLAIVVNRSNPVDNLSLAELRTIFLSGRSHWTNERRITLVMREPGEPERKTIVHDVCGMNENQLKTHVLHGLFTGEILVSPKVLATASGVRKFIFNVPGAIGYLRLSDVDDTVKVVRIDNLFPSDKAYKLRVQNQTGY
jgi:phosphate transport system substrate-binding protein